MGYANLKAELARKGLTVKDLPDILGISKSACCKRLSGESDWKLREVKKLQKYLDVDLTIDELFKWEG